MRFYSMNAREMIRIPSRMSGQVPKLGLKYWKLRARKLTLNQINAT